MLKRTFLVIVAIITLISLFSGCKIGLGIGVETRVGVIYFLSSRDDVSGELYLDGQKIGYLAPHQYLGQWVFLDFKHQVELHCEHCGSIHVMVVNPPLYAGQIVTLDFAHEG
ncbi:MAG: hypothetical protein ACP5Q4_04395 [Candidatus Caldatribacteriaceae bacterium]